MQVNSKLKYQFLNAARLEVEVEVPAFFFTGHMTLR